MDEGMRDEMWGKGPSEVGIGASRMMVLVTGDSRFHLL